MINLNLFKTKILAILLIIFSMVSCNQEISDFFESIRDHGYRSNKPLGPQTIKIKEDFLGGYVYKELPLIISKKTDYIYEINFLTPSLHKEDRVVEAHITKLSGFTFMNLKMGDYYCFLKFNMLFDEELQVDLVKNSLADYVESSNFKSWLRKNADKGIHTYMREGEEQELDAFYSFVFKKITVTRAYEIQEEKLTKEKQELFTNCSSYRRYEYLINEYPNDEYKILAEQSLFSKCVTVYEYEAYIAYFPNSEFVQNANIKIKEIKEAEERLRKLKLDKKNYQVAIENNTFESLELFLTNRLTEVYVDSISIKTAKLAQEITKEDIEWKWSGGEREAALQLIFYKIDYVNNIFDMRWMIEHLSLYAIKQNALPLKQKSLTYMDKLLEKKPDSDDILYLFLEKGFILWSMDKTDLSVDLFALKIRTEYKNGDSFKAKLKDRYNHYTKTQNISFPNQKSTWKLIKKLK